MSAADELPAAEARTRFYELPERVQHMVRHDFEQELWNDFKLLHWQMVEAFLEEPDVAREWADFRDRCWEEQLADSTDQWADYLIGAMAKPIREPSETDI